MKKLLAIFAMALVLSACGKQETLLRDMHERDANEIVAVLYSAGIHAQKHADAKGKTFSVAVDSSLMAQSVTILRAQGLPREARPSLNEVFKSGSFAPSAFEERVRFIYGISQELERTISYMEGALTVRVHVVIPEPSRRRDVTPIPSASVFVNYDDRIPFETAVPRIRKMVSESIEGLKEENIEVLAVPVKVDLSAIKAPSPTGVSPVLSIIVLVGVMVLGLLAYTFRTTLTTGINRLLNKGE